MNPSQVGLSPSSSPELLYFALGISGLIIALLVSLVWKLMSERIKARERETDLLERRLQAGTSKMESQSEAILQLQAESARGHADCVSLEFFGSWSQHHASEHKELERAQAELVAEVRSVGARLDGSLATVTTLLSKLVTLQDRDREDDS